MICFNTLRNVLKNVQLRCSSSKTSSPAVPAKAKMPADLIDETQIKTRAQAKQQLATKEELQWRTPWHEKEGQHYTMLRSFNDGTSGAPSLKFMQQPINLTITGIKSWWNKRKEEHAIAYQQYLPERNQMLGNELAAAHFLVFRGGAVKFFGDDNWIKANSLGDYDLPKLFEDDMFLQAIDCTDMELYYEGMANMRGLKQLEWLSLNGCEHLDDWALDRIGCLFTETLLYLDIRNMPKITYRGIGSLYKLPNLKILYVDNMFFSRDEFEMTCLMLQEVNPALDIRIEE